MSGRSIDALEHGHPLLELLRRHQCVLLAGAPGTGKSTLAARAAAALEARGRRCHLLGADPGLPAAGLPGAVCLAVWERGHWQVEASEALCSLDAARFRLPLVGAVGRLPAQHSCRDGPLIVDAPGVVRGAAAAELLPALAVAARAQAVVVLTPADEAAPLRDELHAVGVAVVPLRADAAARRPGRLARERRRTAPWDAHLEHAPEHDFDVDEVAVVGMAPPRDVPDAWSGRQIGLLGACGQTLGIGEVLTLDGTHLRVRAPPVAEPVAALLVRDAQRNGDGMLVTAVPFRKPDEAAPPPEVVGPARRAGAADGPLPVVRTGLYHAVLVNGVFGDPLLHIRLRHQRRSLLFDLGRADRLPARIAHQITDVFVTHAGAVPAARAGAGGPHRSSDRGPRAHVDRARMWRDRRRGRRRPPGAVSFFAAPWCRARRDLRRGHGGVPVRGRFGGDAVTVGVCAVCWQTVRLGAHERAAAQD